MSKRHATMPDPPLPTDDLEDRIPSPFEAEGADDREGGDPFEVYDDNGGVVDHTEPYRAPPLPPSGNPATDRVVGELARQGSMTTPRPLSTVEDYDAEILRLNGIILDARVTVQGLTSIRNHMLKLRKKGYLPGT